MSAIAALGIAISGLSAKSLDNALAFDNDRSQSYPHSGALTVLRTRSRTAASMVVAVALLHSLVAPEYLWAVERGRQAKRTALSQSAVIELYSNSGRLLRRLVGSQNQPPVGGFRALDKGTRAALDSARQQLTVAATRPGGGRHPMARTLLVLDALMANDAETFHQRIQLLQVSIRRYADTDSLGRAGVSTEYVLDGNVKVRTFRLSDDPLPEADAGSVSSFPGEAETEPSPELQSAVLESQDIVPNTSRSACEYSDDEDYWSGECATQQDIDDGWSAYVAAEADAEAAQVEGESDQAAVDAYCIENSVECQATTDENEMERTGPAYDMADGNQYGLAPADALSNPSGPVLVIPCLGHASGFLAASVGAGMAAGKIVAVLSAANPPLGAIVASVALFGIAVATLGYAAYSFSTCVSNISQKETDLW